MTVLRGTAVALVLAVAVLGVQPVVAACEAVASGLQLRAAAAALDTHPLLSCAIVGALIGAAIGALLGAWRS